MSKPSLVIVLAEDQRQKQFIYRFLIGVGLRPSQMRMIVSPSGQGAAEHWVRKNFVSQVRICRARHAKTGLFILLDADKESVVKHWNELDNALVEQNLPKVDSSHDFIARLIPKWSIETWILDLTAENKALTEDQPYKRTKTEDEWTALVPDAATALADWTRNNASIPVRILDSLQRGISEIPRAL